MKKPLLLFLLIPLLSACSPSLDTLAMQTTRSWIPTPEPTVTPTPEPITGKLFWDANGSGLQDETNFIVPEYDEEDLPYFFELLESQGTAIEDLIPGELATVPEPDIPGMRVCVGEVCTETDGSGEFTIFPEKYLTSYKLRLKDPNKGDPEKEFRYVNLWKGGVVVEAHEVDGVFLPEQYLNDTEIVELDRGIGVSADEEKSIGLMQGFLTYPYTKSKYYVGIWYDHLLENGSYLNYEGDTNPYNNPAGIQISGDNHDGTDYAVPNGTKVTAMAEGKVNYSDLIRQNGPLHTTIEHLDGKHATGTGHHSKLLVNRDDKIFRGQLVALSGKSGTSWPHIHLSVHYDYDKRNVQVVTMDPYGTLFDNENYFEKQSWWTVYNIPQFPLVEIVE